MSRKQLLMDRLENMLKLKTEELKLKKPSRTFISDLNESIAALEMQIENMKDNIELMNGV